MPLYEYQCESCEHRFEVIQKFSDPPADTCPKCAGVVRRLLSSPAIQFKGSGWYITDYARKSGGGPSSKPGEGAPAGGPGEQAPGKTDTAKSESSSPAPAKSD
jgi:putative FmdB family regulatory protein